MTHVFFFRQPRGKLSPAPSSLSLLRKKSSKWHPILHPTDREVRVFSQLLANWPMIIAKQFQLKHLYKGSFKCTLNGRKILVILFLFQQTLSVRETLTESTSSDFHKMLDFFFWPALISSHPFPWTTLTMLGFDHEKNSIKVSFFPPLALRDEMKFLCTS